MSASSIHALTTISPTRTHHLSLPFVIALELIRCIESLLAIVANGVTIACIVRYKRLRGPTNYLVGSLAMADLLSGVNHMVFLELLFTKDAYHWRGLCIANQTVAILVTAANIVHIAVISVDRYIAVSRPTTYKHVITRRRIYITIAIIWLTIMTIYIPVMITGSQSMTGHEDICSYLSILPPDLFSAAALPLVGITILVSLTSYSMIYCRLKRHSRRMSQTLEVTTQRQVSHESVEQSATRAMVIVMLTFAISTLPPVIYTLVVSEDDPLRPYVFRIVIALWYVSSFINPFIYAWKNERYREAFRHMLTRRGERMRAGRSTSVRT